MFLPAILVGIIGGVLGATFTLLNMRLVKQRSQLVNFFSRPAAKNVVRMLEPVIIMVSNRNKMHTATVVLSSVFFLVYQHKMIG